MKTQNSFIISLLLASVVSAQEFPRKALDLARTELHRQVQDGHVAGATHLVVRDGQTLYSEVAGYGDIEDKTPFRMDSILRIYSMSKPITTVAAMTLHEQGKFKLDDPIAMYIPAFTHTTVLQKTGETIQCVSPKSAISIRDVLRHTTGYSYGDEAAVKDYYEREGMRYWGPAEMFPPRMTIEKAAVALARIPALHHPGERFTYGFSSDLLGRLIEVWSGQPLDVFLRQAVLEPLEMNDTGFSVPKEKRTRFTSCHVLLNGKLAVADKATSSPFNDGFEFLSGGGGLVSTVRDYANFCQMLVDGGQFKGRRLLKEDTIKLMFTDQLNGVAGPFQFGFSFAINEIKLGSGESRRTALQFSWGGYASTAFRLVPGERLFQIFARQQVPDSNDLADKLIATIYDGLTTSAKTTKTR
jgi:CubicO group peptidase (beta-lactamase class C family)